MSRFPDHLHFSLHETESRSSLYTQNKDEEEFYLNQGMTHAGDVQSFSMQYVPVQGSVNLEGLQLPTSNPAFYPKSLHGVPFWLWQFQGSDNERPQGISLSNISDIAFVTEQSSRLTAPQIPPSIAGHNFVNMRDIGLDIWQSYPASLGVTQFPSFLHDGLEATEGGYMNVQAGMSPQAMQTDPISLDKFKNTVASTRVRQASEKRRQRDAKYPCSVCSACFTSAQNRDNHYNSHYGRKPYKCSVCENGFAARSTRNKHQANCGQR